MSKDKSYTELMKKCAMNRQKQKENFMQDLFIDMMLNEILLNYLNEELDKKIDKAIDTRNETLFKRLCCEKAQLRKRFGT